MFFKLQPEIVYKNPDFLVINKPAGLLVHKTANSMEKTLADWLVENYPEVRGVGDDPITRPGIVHRIDKDTSGIMIIPRNQKYFEYLKDLFKTRKIKKTYFAWVLGEVKSKSGVIDKPIGIKSGSTRRSVYSSKMAKSAITRFIFLKGMEKEGGEYSLLKIMPETGRTHQIRVHLASIGHPVLGDKLYGRKNRPGWVKNLLLHAYSLEIVPKTGEKILLEVDPPFYFPTVEE